MSSYYFVVVDFTLEDEIAIVSSRWLSRDQTRSKWPPGCTDKAKKAAREHQKPAADWPWFPVELLDDGTADTYENGRKKLVKAENYKKLKTTDDESQERKKRIPSRYQSSEEDVRVNKRPKQSASATVATNQRKPLPVPPTFPSYVSSGSSSSTTSPPIQSSTTLHVVQSSLARAIPQSSSAQLSSTPSSSNASSGVIRLLLDIKTQLRQHTAILHSLVNKVDGNTRKDDDEIVDDNLPLSSIAEWEGVEERLLNDQSFKKNMIKWLTRLGGTSEQQVVVKIMAEMMTDDFARLCNWKGRGAKTGLAGSQVVDVICRAARQVWKTSDDTSAGNIIKNWLKYAGDRSGGRKERENRKVAAKQADSADGDAVADMKIGDALSVFIADNETDQSNGNLSPLN